MSKTALLALIWIGVWIGFAQAQHVIVLKNGRHITVQSYREEGAMIKFAGLGGEIGIPKDQVKAILKPGQTDRPGLSLPAMESASRQAPSHPPKPSSAEPPGASPAPPEEYLPDAEEVKSYQKRLAELTRALEEAREKYFNATQGGGTASNLSKEGIRAWAADFASRIHDSQKVPGGGGPASTPPTPPYAPNYTPREKELSELRNQIDALQKERAALLEEMERKNIPTGAF